MFHKLLVSGAGLLAVILGLGAVSTWQDGGGGYARLLGLILAAGALAMGVLALRLHLAGPGALQRGPHRYVPTVPERRGYLFVAALVFVFCAYSLLSGAVPARHKDIERRTDPHGFWTSIVFFRRRRRVPALRTAPAAEAAAPVVRESEAPAPAGPSPPAVKGP